LLDRELFRDPSYDKPLFGKSTKSNFNFTCSGNLNFFSTPFSHVRELEKELH